MNKNRLITTVWVAVLVGWIVGLPGLSHAAGTPAVKQKVELLFVQNSKGVAIDKDKRTLTLKGVGATTLFFSDRPVRMAGHYSMQEYLDFWKEGKDNFSVDPPNATLSVFEPGQDDLLDVVVKLQNPRTPGRRSDLRHHPYRGAIAQEGWTVFAFYRHLRCLAPHGPTRSVGQRGRRDHGRGRCGGGRRRSSHDRDGPADSTAAARPSRDGQSGVGCRATQGTQVTAAAGTYHGSAIQGRVPEAAQPDRGIGHLPIGSIVVREGKWPELSSL